MAINSIGSGGDYSGYDAGGYDSSYVDDSSSVSEVGTDSTFGTDASAGLDLDSTGTPDDASFSADLDAPLASDPSAEQLTAAWEANDLFGTGQPEPPSLETGSTLAVTEGPDAVTIRAEGSELAASTAGSEAVTRRSGVTYPNAPAADAPDDTSAEPVGSTTAPLRAADARRGAAPLDPLLESDAAERAWSKGAAWQAILPDESTQPAPEAGPVEASPTAESLDAPESVSSRMAPGSGPDTRFPGDAPAVPRPSLADATPEPAVGDAAVDTEPAEPNATGAASDTLPPGAVGEATIRAEPASAAVVTADERLASDLWKNEPEPAEVREATADPERSPVLDDRTLSPFQSGGGPDTEPEPDHEFQGTQPFGESRQPVGDVQLDADPAQQGEEPVEVARAEEHEQVEATPSVPTAVASDAPRDGEPGRPDEHERVEPATPRREAAANHSPLEAETHGAEQHDGVEPTAEERRTAASNSPPRAEVPTTETADRPETADRQLLDEPAKASSAATRPAVASATEAEQPAPDVDAATRTAQAATTGEASPGAAADNPSPAREGRQAEPVRSDATRQDEVTSASRGGAANTAPDQPPAATSDQAATPEPPGEPPASSGASSPAAILTEEPLSAVTSEAEAVETTNHLSDAGQPDATPAAAAEQADAAPPSALAARPQAATLADRTQGDFPPGVEASDPHSTAAAGAASDHAAAKAPALEKATTLPPDRQAAAASPPSAPEKTAVSQTFGDPKGAAAQSGPTPKPAPLLSDSKSQVKDSKSQVKDSASQVKDSTSQAKQPDPPSKSPSATTNSPARAATSAPTGTDAPREKSAAPATPDAGLPATPASPPARLASATSSPTDDQAASVPSRTGAVEAKGPKAAPGAESGRGPLVASNEPIGSALDATALQSTLPGPSQVEPRIGGAEATAAAGAIGETADVGGAREGGTGDNVPDGEEAAVPARTTASETTTSTSRTAARNESSVAATTSARGRLSSPEPALAPAAGATAPATTLSATRPAARVAGPETGGAQTATSPLRSRAGREQIGDTAGRTASDVGQESQLFAGRRHGVAPAETRTGVSTAETLPAPTTRPVSAVSAARFPGQSGTGEQGRQPSGGDQPPSSSGGRGERGQRGTRAGEAAAEGTASSEGIARRARPEVPEPRGSTVRAGLGLGDDLQPSTAPGRRTQTEINASPLREPALHGQGENGMVAGRRAETQEPRLAARAGREVSPLGTGVSGEAATGQKGANPAARPGGGAGQTATGGGEPSAWRGSMREGERVPGVNRGRPEQAGPGDTTTTGTAPAAARPGVAEALAGNRGRLDPSRQAEVKATGTAPATARPGSLDAPRPGAGVPGKPAATPSPPAAAPPQSQPQGDARPRSAPTPGSETRLTGGWDAHPRSASAPTAAPQAARPAQPAAASAPAPAPPSAPAARPAQPTAASAPAPRAAATPPAPSSPSPAPGSAPTARSAPPAAAGAARPSSPPPSAPSSAPAARPAPPPAAAPAATRPAAASSFPAAPPVRPSAPPAPAPPPAARPNSGPSPAQPAAAPAGRAAAAASSAAAPSVRAGASPAAAPAASARPSAPGTGRLPAEAATGREVGPGLAARPSPGTSPGRAAAAALPWLPARPGVEGPGPAGELRLPLRPGAAEARPAAPASRAASPEPFLPLSRGPARPSGLPLVPHSESGSAPAPRQGEPVEHRRRELALPGAFQPPSAGPRNEGLLRRDLGAQPSTAFPGDAVAPVDAPPLVHTPGTAAHASPAPSAGSHAAPHGAELNHEPDPHAVRLRPLLGGLNTAPAGAAREVGAATRLSEDLRSASADRAKSPNGVERRKDREKEKDSEKKSTREEKKEGKAPLPQRPIVRSGGGGGKSGKAGARGPSTADRVATVRKMSEQFQVSTTRQPERAAGQLPPPPGTATARAAADETRTPFSPAGGEAHAHESNRPREERPAATADHVSRSPVERADEGRRPASDLTEALRGESTRDSARSGRGEEAREETPRGEEMPVHRCPGCGERHADPGLCRNCRAEA